MKNSSNLKFQYGIRKNEVDDGKQKTKRRIGLKIKLNQLVDAKNDNVNVNEVKNKNDLANFVFFMNLQIYSEIQNFPVPFF